MVRYHQCKDEDAKKVGQETQVSIIDHLYQNKGKKQHECQYNRLKQHSIVCIAFNPMNTCPNVSTHHKTKSKHFSVWDSDNRRASIDPISHQSTNIVKVIHTQMETIEKSLRILKYTLFLELKHQTIVMI